MSVPFEELRVTIGPAPDQRLDKALAVAVPEGHGLSRSRLQALIAEGAQLARTAVRAGGWYGLQAALAAEHSLAPSAQATRWSAIVDLYDRLLTFGAHPVLLLNRAVALGMRDGAQATLAALDELGRPPELAADHALEAVRADALRRLGCTEEAAVHYRAARELAPNVAVAHEYQRRLTALDERSDGVGPR